MKKKVYVALLFAALTCGAFLMPFEKNAKAELCGRANDGVCSVAGSSCYCLDPE